MECKALLLFQVRDFGFRIDLTRMECKGLPTLPSLGVSEGIDLTRMECKAMTCKEIREEVNV